MKTISAKIMSPKMGTLRNGSYSKKNVIPNHLNSYGMLNLLVNNVKHLNFIEMQNIHHLILIEDPKLGKMAGIIFESAECSDSPTLKVIFP